MSYANTEHPVTARKCFRAGFTLIEMLVVISIIALLSTLIGTGVTGALQQAKATASISNLRQLSMATLAYAVDHRGNFPPGMSPNNLERWHGSRSSISAPFKPEGGYLSSYVGNSQRIKRCPLLGNQARKSGSFEQGAGGYGYNSTYLGGSFHEGNHVPFNSIRIAQLSKVIMFTTTAFANGDGVQEYPFTDPYTSPAGYALQPSTHFRANGKALVVWTDGHVTRESPNQVNGPNFYGGNNQDQQIGWFGPEDQNGFWNPQSPH